MCSSMFASEAFFCGFAFQRNKEFALFFLPEGDSVTVTLNWLMLSLLERWRVAEEEEVEKMKRKQPRGIYRGDGDAVGSVNQAVVITSDIKFKYVDILKK